MRGRGLGFPPPKFFENSKGADNHAIWCIFGATFNLLNPKSQDEILEDTKDHWACESFLQQMNSLYMHLLSRLSHDSSTIIDVGKKAGRS